MLKKWRKTTLIIAPLLVIGSVCAYAADSGPSANKLATANAPATTKAVQSGTVTSQVVSSQTLTPEELQALQAAKPTAPAAAATTNASTSSDQSLLDANNPFLVQGGNTATASAANTAPASSNFSLDLVKNLNLTMNTTEGMLTLHFHTEDGVIKLDGNLGGRHLALEGEQALQVLTQLLQSTDLSDALAASLNDQPVSLDPSLIGALQALHIELKDGRKIDSNGHNPKAEGRHDNGKHKGQLKHENANGNGEDEHGDD